MKGERAPVAWLKNRDLRRHVVCRLLGFIFRSAESALAGVRQLRIAEIHRVLVIRPNHRLGNTLLLTPLLAELERTLPGSEIDVLAAGPAARDVLGGFFALRCIHTLPHYIVRHLPMTLRMIATLRRTHYDLAIDPSPESFSSRLLLDLIKPRFAIGIPDPQSECNANWARVMRSAPRHLAKLPVFVLRHALASARTVDEINYPGLDVRLTSIERRAGRRALETLMDGESRCGRPAAIGIFANASGAKRYGESWWLHFLEVLIANHPGCAILEFVAADGISRLGARFPTYYSSNPRKLASVMSNLTCFISGDCGVMHLACACGVPTIGLFCATELSLYEPYHHYNQGVRTPGKSPQHVAQTVSRIVETVVSRGVAGAKQGRPLKQPSTAVDPQHTLGNAAEAQVTEAISSVVSL